MNITTIINVPSDAAYFEGHFPGNPILPGVAEVALAFEALAKEVSTDISLQGIAYMRLRQIVLPDDCLELTTKSIENGRLRVDLKREGRLVANGEWGIGTSVATSDKRLPDSAKMTPLSDIPSLDDLLPHRPPMRFLHSIVSENVESLSCMATIPAACALVDGGSVPAVVGLEAAAQAAAVWEALQRSREGGVAAPRVGYLVALREVAFFTDRIPADQELFVVVKLDVTMPPLSHYEVALYLGEKLLVSGMIATFLKGDE